MENHQFIHIPLEHDTKLDSTAPILKEQTINVQKKFSSSSKQQPNHLKNHQEDFLLFKQSSDYKIDENANLNNIFTSINSSISYANEQSEDQLVREDFLLSSSTIKTEQINSDRHNICKIHDKAEDIICIVQKTKICCYCALFGSHKDHKFKSQSQFIDQIDNLQRKIVSLERNYQKKFQYFLIGQQLKVIQKQCQNKREQAIGQIQQQFNSILQKLTKGKKQTILKIREQYNESLNKIKSHWQKSQSQFYHQKLYKEWKFCGITILSNLRERLTEPDFKDQFRQYDQFPWEKGQIIFNQYEQQLDSLKKKCKDQIDDLRFQNNFSLKNYLLNILQFDSDNTISINALTPSGSLQELSKQLNYCTKNQFIKVESPYQIFQHREKTKFRHSELFEPQLRPIEEEGKKNERQKRVTSKALGSKQPISCTNSLNTSTVMTRVKSNSRIQISLLSPKSRGSVYRSPQHNRQNRNPMKIVTQYQKNGSQTCLNFSNCGLNIQQLLFFIEKAFNKHIPSEINLQKNKISITGLAKLLPFLSRVYTANLCKTELDEGCLDLICKLKASRRLSQIILSQSQISSLKNNAKLDQLRKIGLKITLI